MTKALIVVDWQEEWRTEESEEFVGDLKEETARAKNLIDYCRENGIPVIFTRHVDPESEDAFSGPRAEIMPELEVGSSKVVTKNRISPLYGTDLENILKELKAEEVIVAGILTNLCVRSLVSDLYDRDYGITVVKDCCVTYKPEVQRFTFEDLKETRPEINFINLEELVK